jgi:predicted CopG family antitoxin
VKKLEKFYQDPQSFSDVRRNAVKHVRENFDIQKTASLLHHSIQKAVEEVSD